MKRNELLSLCKLLLEGHLEHMNGVVISVNIVNMEWEWMGMFGNMSEENMSYTDKNLTYSDTNCISECKDLL